jgi:hypothetical protein
MHVRKRETGQGEGRMGRAAREREKEEGEASRCRLQEVLLGLQNEQEVALAGHLGAPRSSSLCPNEEDKEDLQKTPWVLGFSLSFENSPSLHLFSDSN